MDYNRLIQYIRPKNLIDIGAHIGSFTKNIVSLSPHCESIMVEANPNCLEFLENSGYKFDLIGLSNFNGYSNLFVEKQNNIGSGSSLFRENTVWYEDGKFDIIEIPILTLDNCDYFPNEIIDLIKIDVQGSELNILSGGRKTVRRSKFVLIEVSLIEYNIKAPLIDQVITKMREYEFEIKDILGYHKLDNGQIFQLDMLFKNSYIG
jgi:FkbM family methyltransferase